jgi:hypothetical protein
VCCVSVKVARRAPLNVVFEDHTENSFLCVHKPYPGKYISGHLGAWVTVNMTSLLQLVNVCWNLIRGVKIY